MLICNPICSQVKCSCSLLTFSVILLFIFYLFPVFPIPLFFFLFFSELHEQFLGFHDGGTVVFLKLIILLCRNQCGFAKPLSAATIPGSQTTISSSLPQIVRTSSITDRFLFCFVLCVFGPVSNVGPSSERQVCFQINPFGCLY